MLYLRISSLLISLSFLYPLSLHSATQSLKQFNKGSLYHQLAQELSVEPEQAHQPNQGSEQLTEGQQRTIALKLLSEYSSPFFEARYATIDTEDIRKDLEFFRQANLYKKLRRTKTAFGDIVFARRLAEPTADKEELAQRQAIVKKLLEDEELFNALDTALTEIKKAEPVILSFFSSQNELRQQMLRHLYFDKTLWGGFPGYSDEWDKNEKALLVTEGLQKGRLLWSIMSFAARTKISLEVFNAKVLGATWGLVALLRFRPDILQQVAAPLLFGGLGWSVYKYRKNRLNPVEDQQLPPQIQIQGADDEQRNWVRQVADTAWQKTTNGWNKYTKMERTWNSWEMAALLPLALFNEMRTMYGWQRTIEYLQQRFQHLGESVRKMRTIGASMHSQGFMHLIPEAEPLMNLFDTERVSDDMQRLLTMLESKTFQGEHSVLSHFGRIAATNKVMDAAKYDWIEIFESIGYLDVYLSTAKLIKEFQGKENGFCFANYVDATTPVLSLQQFWDPLLDNERAVPNSISLANPHQNVLLTGPNTGGKSTVIKGIMLNVLCAQTLGIVPAQSCTLTPFSAFNTYSRVEDDIEHELSLFAAEVQRANHLKQKIVDLPQDQFGLTIIDEMFRGTAPDNAEQLSYHYAVDFGNCPNSICFMATHYPKLINLENETNGKFQNYKVEIEKLADGTLKRNYKLTRGSTTQNVALDILREQGLL
jgi:hypothetical protein